MINYRRILLAATAIVSVTAGAGMATARMTGDTLSLQGSWMNFEPSTDARRFAIECVDCSDSSDISAEDFVLSHESDFQDMFGAIKYTHALSGNNDMAFGISGGSFATDTARFTPLYQQDGQIGTPYGTVDSSSTSDGATNKDQADFLIGDFEYAWNGSDSRTNYRYFVGARAEMLNWSRTAAQDLSSSNVYAGAEDSEFLGIGPRIGIAFDMPLGARNNFGVFGGLSGGAMLGRLEQRFHVDSSTTADGDLDNYSKTVFAPFVDAELGVVANVSDGIKIEMGYQAGFTASVLRTATVCTDDNDDDVKPYNDSCGDATSDVLAHGAFIRLTGAL